MRTAGASAVVVALVIAACGSGHGHAGEIPTESAARAYLTRIVGVAQRGDLAAFCEVVQSNCETNAEAAGGPAAMPPNPPLVAGTRVIPTTINAEAMSAGGQLLVVCGRDGLGKSYRTEVLVSVGYDGALYAINGVYWSGAGLAVSPDTGSATGGAGIECPGG